MHVPLLDLSAQNKALETELKTAFERVIHSSQFILGPELQSFERAVAQMTATRHAIGVSSGTDAILLALMTLGIGVDDEVLCPTYTFFATAGCIARTGATPVFVDSCSVCFNLDVADAAQKVTPRTKAIIPVHLFGQAAEMDAVMALAKRHNLRVIEDCAQALGASYRGRKLGSIGDLGAFSFFPSKNLGGFGDSGMLVTNDDALAERARLLRTHGSKPKYYHKYVGANFRMDPLQAALLSVKLPHLSAYTRKRCENAAYYTEKLAKQPRVVVADHGESGCLCARAEDGGQRTENGGRKTEDGERRTECSTLRTSGSSGIILPTAYPHNDHIWNQYTLRVLGHDQRDKLKKFLIERSIGTEIYYPVPMHQQECFAHFVPRDADQSPGCPVASELATEALSIPIFPELARDQQDTVITAIGDFLEQAWLAG